MSRTVKDLNITILASYNTKLDDVTVRAFPEGYGFMANDNEIVIDDSYPIRVEIEDLSEQDIIIKAIETIEARKNKILADAMLEAGKLEDKLQQLKQITFVG